MRPFAARPHRVGARVRTADGPGGVPVRRGPVRRPGIRAGTRAGTRAGALAVAASVAAALGAGTTVGAGAAVAAAAPDVTLHVTGTVRVVMVDDFHEERAGESPTEVLTMLEVDGRLHDLTGHPELDVARNGAEVVLTLEADAGTTGDEALIAVARAEPGSAVAPDGTATLVDVAPLAQPDGRPGDRPADAPADAPADVPADGPADDPADPPLTSDGHARPAAALGAHSITVLPVHGGTLPAGEPSTSQLSAWATKAGQYWTEQSGGRLTFSASVREWTPVTMPTTCDSDALFASALAAHGGPPVSETQHVVVYFPELAACEWAGLGTLIGGEVWVNGLVVEDVLTHELGHNLGLGHANTLECAAGGARVTLHPADYGSCHVQEYADYADVMGIATSMRSGNLTTAAADALGFARVTHVAAPLTAAAYLDLAPLGQVGAVRAVSLPAPGIPNGRLYVDFRPATGRDVRMPAWAGVQVHLSVLNGRDIPETYLLDMRPTTTRAFASPSLAPGTGWSVPQLDLAVHVRSVGTSARVAVTSSQAPLDTTAPTKAVVTAPVAGSVATGAVTARWHAAADDVRVTAYEVLVDGTVVRRVAGSVTSVDLGALPPGPRTVSVDALDAAGNRAVGARVGFTAATDATQRFVARVYGDLFGRSPDGAGLVTWATALDAGTPRTAVANAITSSDEYRGRLIRGSYAQYLGRGADAGGLASWLGAMRGGLTIQQMEAGFVASPEYYLQSGSDDARWITRLYQHVLGRTPAPTEVRHWQRQLAAGAGRDRVAIGFLLSTEHLTTAVDGHYRHLLGRGIDPTGAAHWVTAIQRGTRIESIVGGIIASQEYAMRG